MDTNFYYYLEMMFAFMAFGCMFFVWIWVDWREKRKSGHPQMRSKHYHHVMLGLWPFFTTLLLFLLYGKVSFVSPAILLFVVFTGLLFYCSGLWDLRHELVEVQPPRMPEWSTAALRAATHYPILELVAGVLGTSLGLSFLVIADSSPSELQGYIRVSILFVIMIGMGLLSKRLIKAWMLVNQQSRVQARERGKRVQE